MVFENNHKDLKDLLPEAVRQRLSSSLGLAPFLKKKIEQFCEILIIFRR